MAFHKEKKKCFFSEHAEAGFGWLSTPGGSDDKKSARNVRDPSSIPRSGRSPGDGNDNPVWYSCLENSMDREAW